MTIAKTKIKRLMESCGVKRLQKGVVESVKRRAEEHAKSLIKKAEERTRYAGRKTLMHRDLLKCEHGEPVELTRNSIKRLINQTSDCKSTDDFKKILATKIEEHISHLTQKAYSYSRADERKTLRIKDLKEAHCPEENNSRKRREL